MTLLFSTRTLVVPIVLLGKADAFAQEEIASGEAIIIEFDGVEPSLEFDYEVAGRSVVYLYAESDTLDPLVMVEDEDLEVLGQDDNSGGGTSAYLELEVEPGSTLWITLRVAAADDGVSEGEIRLKLTEVPRLDVASLPRVSEATRWIEQSLSCSDRGEYEVAREVVREAVALLISFPEPITVEVAAALWRAGFAGEAAQDSATAQQAWERVWRLRDSILPDQHTYLQNARGNLAITMQKLGNLEGARLLQEKIMRVFSQTLPDYHPVLQSARSNLASTMQRLGNLEEAQELQEKVLHVRARTLPDHHRDLQSARHNLAFTRLKLGDLQGARRLQEKVLGIWEQVLPDRHPDIQRARGNLALTKQKLGELEEARLLQERVLKVFTEILPDNDLTLVGARSNLATTLLRLGDVEGARRLQEEVLEVLVPSLPDHHPDVQSARHNLAATMLGLGDYEGARLLQEKVLDVWSRVLPDRHPVIQSARSNLAWAMQKLGDLEGARLLQERVLDARTRTLPDHHPDVRSARNNLAAVMHELGDYESALLLQHKVLAIASQTLPDDHLEVQSARHNLAGTMRRLGDLQGALLLQEKVLGVLIRVLPESHPTLQSARLNLAGTMQKLGDLEGARALQEKVLEILTRTLPGHHPDVQRARGNLALTRARLRLDVTELLGSLADGATKRVGIFAPRLSPRELRVLASLERKRMSSALSLSRLPEICNTVSLSSQMFSLIEAMRGIEPSTMRYQRGLAMVEDEELFLLQKEAARTSQALARHSRGKRSLPSTDDVRSEVDADSEGDQFAEFQELFLAKEAAESRVSRYAAAILGEKNLIPSASCEELAAEMDGGTALVGFWEYTLTEIDESTRKLLPGVPNYLAHVLLANGQLTRLDLGPVAIVDEAIQEWRSSMQVEKERTERGSGSLAGKSPGEDRDPQREAGQRLRELVFDPLEPFLGNATRLIVALDGALHLIPFAALPDAEGALGDQFEFSYRTTLRELTAPPPILASEPRLLALGGVQYDLDRGLEATETQGGSRSIGLPSNLRNAASWRVFSPLPHSEREIDLVARSFAEKFPRVDDATNSFLLKGENASREALRRLAPQVRYLHLATHGYFLDESIPSMADERVIDHELGISVNRSLGEQVRGFLPMTLCGLALAGANDPANEFGRVPGILTAQDLAQWDLGNCELAVLSACNTNVGVQRAGQGIASLQEALYAAGVRSSITSLWEVSDRPTQELFAEFYRRLWLLGEGKAEALWNAQQKLRHAKDAEGNPVFTTRDWAAWVLVGERD